MDVSEKDKTTEEQNSNNKLVDVDEYIIHVGEFGKRQIILQIMLFPIVLMMTYQFFLLVFVGNNPAWKCTGLNPECNNTGQAFDIGHEYYDHRCKLDNRSSWQFVRPKKFSIVTEWDLVCKKRELSYFASAAYYLGGMTGTFVIGRLCDRFGRKSVFFASTFITAICVFSTAFVQQFWTFFAMRCIIGFLNNSNLTVVLVLVTELVGPRFRALSGNAIWLGFSTAICLLGVQAWLVPDWRIIHIITSAPYIIFILCFWKFVPESVRWLRVNGRQDEAEDILRKTAKMNGKSPPCVKLSTVVKETRNGRFRELFRPWSACRNMLIQCFIWFAILLVYYGIPFAIDDLGGSMYRDFILTGLVEFPAGVLGIIFANRFGRKKTTAILLLISSVSLAIIAVIPNEKDVPNYMWSRVFVGLCGKFAISLSINTLYIWSAELIPTVVRSQGLCLLVLMGALGSFCAPWIAQWLRHFHAIAPYVAMGATGIIATALCFLSPETNGEPTKEVLTLDGRDNVLDVEMPSVIANCLVDDTEVERKASSSNPT